MKATYNLAQAQKQIKQCKAMLFDLDGTILDLEALNIKSYAIPLKKALDIVVTDKMYFRYISGKPRKAGIINLLKNLDVKCSITDVDKLSQMGVETKRKLLSSNKFYDYVYFKNGVCKFLQYWSNKKQIALVTSTRKILVDILLSKLDIKSLFKVIITADDITHGKPNPEPFITAMDKLSVSADKSVAFEDSLYGIQSAKDAGCFTICIYTKGINDEWISNANAWISTYMDLM